MKITTRSNYGLEVIVESENTLIKEDVSRSVFSKTEKNGLGLPLKIAEKVDEDFKQDALSLVEDIYRIEKVGTEEILKYFWERCDNSEKEEFLEYIKNERV